MEDIIDQSSEGGNQEVPQAVKTLGILSIIGSSLWGLLVLILMFWFLSASSSMGRMLPIADPGGMMAALIIAFLILVAINALAILGVTKMMKGKKGGFILYAIMNGLWALLILMGASNGENPAMSIIIGLVSVGFIIAFGMQMKNMPSN